MTPAPWSKAVPLLVLAGVLAYANSLTKAFVFDDNWWIVKGDPLAAPFDWSRLGASRSLVMLSLHLNHKLSGLSPVGYRLTNVVIHVLAGLTLYGIVRRTLRLPRWDGQYAGRADGLAFAAALLWLVHPLNTQAVTYVIQRCESLMGLFYLLSLYAWLRGATADRRGWAWHLASVAAFGLSGMCKEVAATLPAVLVLYDRVFLARSWGELVRRRWAAYLLLAAVGGWLASGFVYAAFSRDTASGGAGFALASTAAQEAATPKTYALTQTEVILHYLRLAVWPTGQSLDYLGWPLAHSLGEVWPAAAAVGALLVATAVLLVVRPPVGFLGAWFFLILAPTSSVMPIIDPVFEHRMYLPLIAVVVGLVFAAAEVVRRLVPDPWRAAGVGLGLTAVAAALLARQTAVRNEAYRSSLSIWQDVMAKRPGSLRGRYTVAELYLKAGQPELARPLLEQLRKEAPGHPFVELNAARYLEAVGRFKEAAVVYRACAAEEAKLGPLAVIPLAKVLLADGHPAEAVEALRPLAGPDSTDASAVGWLAVCQHAAGRTADARATWERATRLAPGVASEFVTLARTAALTGEAAGKLDRRLAMPVALAVSQFSARPSAVALDTLAILQAADGDYRTAAATGGEAAKAAEAEGDASYVRSLQERVKLYASSKPYGPTAAKGKDAKGPG